MKKPKSLISPRFFNGQKFKYHQTVFTEELRDKIKERLKQKNYYVRCIYYYGSTYLNRKWTQIIKIYKRKKT